MAWATPDDVRSLAGRDVDSTLVDQAQGVIELTVGGRLATLTSDTVSTGTLDWLRRAVAYQAAWMASHPDYYDRMDVSSFSQDGLSANLKADALTLAPLARRCLRHLAGQGTRTADVGDPSATVRGNWYTSDDIDDSLPWKPLGR